MHYKIRGKWLDFKYYFLPRKHYFISTALFVFFSILIFSYGRVASSQFKEQQQNPKQETQPKNLVTVAQHPADDSKPSSKQEEIVPQITNNNQENNSNNQEQSDLLYQLFVNDLEEGGDFSLEDEEIVDYDGYFKQMEFQTYIIRNGDSINSIAKKFKLDTDTIISFNDIKSRLTSGNTLVIPNMKGILHTVKKNESLAKIAAQYKQYKVRLDDIIFINQISDESVTVGERLFIPGAKLPLDNLVDKLKDVFAYPVAGLVVSGVGNRIDPFTFTKSFHPGVDIKARYGSPVRAARDGKVTFAGLNGGYGKLVVINHGGGLETFYGHLSVINVKVGQKVNKRFNIGKVGSTGRSTGPHLHFEVRKDGKIQTVLKKFKGLAASSRGAYWGLN